MCGCLPLPSLLSHALVAFTVEFDNEFERQMPHRTTNHGRTPGSPYAPWLVSLAMWENCMRFVGEEGVRVRELEELARTATNLNGMERWGYVVVRPEPANRTKLSRRDWVIRATPAGRKAQEIWRPLFHTIEQRWQVRFGTEEIGQVRESLWWLIRRMQVDLPDCLPILRYGLFSKGPERELPAPTREDNAGLPLSALLSRVLLAFAIEFEHNSELSLAIGANLLRVLEEKGVGAPDLPRVSGVSKELVKNSVGFLEKRGYVAIEPAPSLKPAKLVRLTRKGEKSQNACRQRLCTIEERWQTRFGTEAIHHLRESLERLVGEPTTQQSPLFRGLEPYPGGWRAALPKPETLPHYPMVTHRGGFPDGS